MAKTAAKPCKVKKALTPSITRDRPQSYVTPLPSYPLSYLMDLGMREIQNRPMICICESLYIFAYGDGFTIFWMENVGSLLYHLAIGAAAKKIIYFRVACEISSRSQRAIWRVPSLLSLFYQQLFEVAFKDPDITTSKVICSALEEALDEYRKLLHQGGNKADILGRLGDFQEAVTSWRKYIETDIHSPSTLRSIRNKFKRAAYSYSIRMQSLDDIIEQIDLQDDSRLDNVHVQVELDGSATLKTTLSGSEGISFVAQYIPAPKPTSSRTWNMPTNSARDALSRIWDDKAATVSPLTTVVAFTEFCNLHSPSVFIDAFLVWTKVTSAYVRKLIVVPDALFLLETIYTADEFTRVTTLVDSYYLVEWACMYVNFIKATRGELLNEEDCEAKRMRAMSLLSTQVMYGMDCENPDMLTKVLDIYQKAGLEAELDILKLTYHDYPTMHGRVVNSNPNPPFRNAPVTH